jgi:hypothetical protein
MVTRWLTSVDPPGFDSGEGSIDTFSCTNCHDPHGAAAPVDPTWFDSDVNGFRNLKVQPTGGGGGSANDPDGVFILQDVAGWVGSSANAWGDGANWTGSGSGATHIWPVINSGNTLNNVYYAGADGTDEGISGWCAQCHDNWHEDAGGASNNESGNDWKRHPVNNAMVDGTPTSSGNITLVDFTFYDGVTDDWKYPAAQSVAPAGIDPTTANETYWADHNADRVFCLSCHFAHGGPFFDALRWDYLSSVGSGTQTGRGDQAPYGCQQCHNR